MRQNFNNMLKGILALSGQSGLFKLIAEAKNNIIVESLENGKRLPVYSSTRVSTLEDIAIYTDTADIPLKEVLQKIAEKESSGKSIDHKSSANILKNYFAGILPDYDRDRVYVSDIRKVILWYNLLQEKGLLDFTEDEEKKEDEIESEEKSEE